MPMPKSPEVTESCERCGRACCGLPLVLWALLAVALGVRLWGAWHANLIFDERAHWALAKTIDVRPGQVHLVSRTLDHPLLSIYVLRLGSVVFGPSDLGLRMFYVLAGTATLVPVYFLGRRVFSHGAGLWAAGLLAVDQFHASWSRVFMPEVLMLLASALVLLQMLRTVEYQRTRDFALLGLLAALAYLAKEPALVLWPVLWLALLVDPDHRRLLLRPAWYLAHGVFLVVIAPDVVLNVAEGTSGYLFRNAVLASEPLGLSLKSASLYLGELFRVAIGPHVLDVDYEQGNVYACLWPAGVFYLVAVGAAVRKCRQPGVRLMLVAFAVVVVAITLVPGGARFEPFWWASISLIPAVVCGGGLLDWLSCRWVSGGWVAAMLIVALGLHYLPVAQRPGPELPRVTVEEITSDFLRRAEAAIGRGDLREARDRYVHVLNLGGPSADAYCGLARVALAAGRTEQATGWIDRALALDPEHGVAVELCNKTQHRER